MTLISQIGVILLIAIIIVVLIRANGTLAEVSEEGEHFIDEWAMKEERKEQRRMEREQVLLQKKAAKASFEDEAEENAEVFDQTEEFFTKAEPVKKENKKIISVPAAEFAYEVTLTLLDENHKPLNSIKIDHYPFTIGRDRDNDLVLDDLCIRGKHAVIEAGRDDVVIRDLGSANKILVNRESFDEVNLADGERFCLGSEEILVSFIQKRACRTIKWG